MSEEQQHGNARPAAMPQTRRPPAGRGTLADEAHHDLPSHQTAYGKVQPCGGKLA